MPKLIEKLGDNKIMVRQAGIQVLRNAMSVTSPGLILDQLLEGFKHSSWRVREEIVSMYIMVGQSLYRSRLCKDGSNPACGIV